MIRAARLLASLGLALALAGCATPDSRIAVNPACPLNRLASVPVQAQGHLLFVTAQIDGTPVILILDTGAERTLLTEATVRRLRLTRDVHHATRTFGIGGPSASFDAIVNSFVLGDARLPVPHVSAGQFTLPPIAGVAPDGLLGADILSHFDVDLDVPAARMTLYQPRFCANIAPPWREQSVALGQAMLRRDRLLVPIALDGVPGQAVLDTGAQATTVSLRLALRAGATSEGLAADQQYPAHGAAPGMVIVQAHRFRELRVGPTVVRAPLLPVVPMPDGMGDALLGGNFLDGRRVWLSFVNQQVFVSAREPPVPQVATARP